MVTASDLARLESEARSCRERAFVIRSGHKIGAAVLMADGRVFGGCTVESVISGLGVCAERLALQVAALHGAYQPRALLVIDDTLTWPCGVCLQYVLQFVQIDGTDVEIIAVSTAGVRQHALLSDLLPRGYYSQQIAERLAPYKRS